jgi:hypothetical protein
MSYSSVSIMNRLWARWVMSWGFIPDWGKRFYSSPNRLTLGPTHSLMQWVLGGCFPGVQWLGCEADLSPPASVAVKNSGAILPLLHMSLWCGAWPLLVVCHSCVWMVLYQTFLTAFFIITYFRNYESEFYDIFERHFIHSKLYNCRIYHLFPGLMMY